MRKTTATDGRCRTRIITEGVIPSLHVYYKNTYLKQYHKTCKSGAALRTETTINNSYDFAVGRLIMNLPKLREIGFAANRRVLEVETVSHDNRVGALAFDTLQKPVTNDEGQRASALRFGDGRVQALFAVLMLLSLNIEGFRNRQLRPLLAWWVWRGYFAAALPSRRADAWEMAERCGIRLGYLPSAVSGLLAPLTVPETVKSYSPPKEIALPLLVILLPLPRATWRSVCGKTSCLAGGFWPRITG